MGPNLLRRRVPDDAVDRVMRWVARRIHLVTDAWFGPRRTHRTLVIEAVAGIPATVLTLQHHLRTQRRFRDDPLVRRSIAQADREQSHFLLFAELVAPTAFERALVAIVQAVAFVAFGLLAAFSERGAQRLAGYLEEEAIESYTDYSRAIERGDVEDLAIPAWAVERWRLEDGSRLGAVVVAIRDEEAEHRDEHHAAADALAANRRRSATREPLGAPV